MGPPCKLFEGNPEFLRMTWSDELINFGLFVYIDIQKIIWNTNVQTKNSTNNVGLMLSIENVQIPARVGIMRLVVMIYIVIGTL